MLELLTQIDTSLFLWLNGKHNAFFDVVMWWLSNRFIWIPLYGFLLFLLIKNYKKQWWIMVLAIIVAVTFTDQMTNFVKYSVERFRPTHTDEISHLIHTLRDYHGGKFGFFSGHAANSFMLFAFISTALRSRYKWIFPLLLFWASAVAYSRIYLGVHFPGDIICGAIFGTLWGWIAARLTLLIIKKRTA